jgi:hypothetical protein
MGGVSRVVIELATIGRSGSGGRSDLRERAKARATGLHESASWRGASWRMEPRIGTDDPGPIK